MVDDKNRISSIGERKGSGKTKAKKTKMTGTTSSNVFMDAGVTGTYIQVIQPTKMFQKRLTEIQVNDGSSRREAVADFPEEANLLPNITKHIHRPKRPKWPVNVVIAIS